MIPADIPSLLSPLESRSIPASPLLRSACSCCWPTGHSLRCPMPLLPCAHIRSVGNIWAFFAQANIDCADWSQGCSCAPLLHHQSRTRHLSTSSFQGGALIAALQVSNHRGHTPVSPGGALRPFPRTEIGGGRVASLSIEIFLKNPLLSTLHPQ